MSVVRSKRGVSNVEFLHTARELEIHTIRKAMGFPKRYRYVLSVPLANLATEIHQLVKEGNSVYPRNQHEVQIRRDYFIRALAALQAFVSQVEVAENVIQIKADQMRYWMSIVSREDRLLRSVLKKDAERYKNLPA